MPAPRDGDAPNSLSLIVFYLYPIPCMACNARGDRRRTSFGRHRHDHNTNRRMLPRWPVALRGRQVFATSKRFAAAAALMTALALCGCGNANFDTTGAWFSKPIDLFGTRSGYTYSNLDAGAAQEHPITANDLVDANGACPAAAAHAPAPPPPAAAAATAGGAQVPPGDLASMLGGGIALGMSECEVAARLGQPNAVNIGKYPNGYRSAILTYNGGPRPGIYRFQAGRLTEMDSVAAPAPPPEPTKKKVAKKKPAKPQEPAKVDSKT
jgi:hypothetical protein